MAYFVYILKCIDGTYYTGSTNNLEKRLKEHTTGKSGAHYTKIRRPVRLLYQEVFDSYRASRAREAAIKRMTKSEKTTLIKSTKVDSLTLD